MGLGKEAMTLHCFLVNYMLKRVSVRSRALYTKQKTIFNLNLVPRGRGVSVLLQVQFFKTSASGNWWVEKRKCVGAEFIFVVWVCVCTHVKMFASICVPSFMCVYLYTWVYMWIYVCIHMHVSKCTYMYVHIYIYTYMQVLHKCLFVCMCVLYMCVHMYVLYKSVHVCRCI